MKNHNWQGTIRGLLVTKTALNHLKPQRSKHSKTLKNQGKLILHQVYTRSATPLSAGSNPADAF